MAKKPKPKPKPRPKQPPPPPPQHPDRDPLNKGRQQNLPNRPLQQRGARRGA